MARLNQSLASGDYPDAELDGTTLTLSRDLLCRNMTRSQAARLLDLERRLRPDTKTSRSSARPSSRTLSFV